MGLASWASAVGFAPVSDLHHQYQEDLILDLVDHTIVPNPDAVAVLTLELLHPRRTRVAGQRQEAEVDPLLDILGSTEN